MPKVTQHHGSRASQSSSPARTFLCIPVAPGLGPCQGPGQDSRPLLDSLGGGLSLEVQRRQPSDSAFCRPGTRQVEFEAEGQGTARWEGCRVCVDGVVVGTAAQCPGPLAPSPALFSIGPGCPGPQWPNLEGESFQEEPLF